MDAKKLKQNNSDNLLWIGLGILVGLGTCLLAVILVIAFLLSLQVPSEAVSDIVSKTPYPTSVPNLQENALPTLSSVQVPVADLLEIGERLLDVDQPQQEIGEIPQKLDLGAKETFWVTDVGTNETNQVEAELVLITDLVYFWITDGVSYELEDVNRLVDNFEQSTYVSVHSMIGSEWSPGVDGDPHLYILYSSGIGSSVAGLFFSKDEYPSRVHEFSNEHEMFYLNADTVNLSEGFAESLLAHEFQHLVHWNLDTNEDTWLNEGFSELTEHLLGFNGDGFDYLFAQDTDIPLLHWPSESASVGEHYGQSFLFLTYLYEQFGPDVIREIAQNPSNGLDSIEEVLIQIDTQDPATGRPTTVEDLILDWGISLVIQNPDVLEGQYGLHSYRSAPKAQFNEHIDDCPSFGLDYTVSQFGFDYFQIDCKGEYDLEFLGETSTEIISAGPRSGDFAYWSNVGDSSDMKLTRDFDFRGASKPIYFDYWTWYNIEQDYDYLYLEASNDGGETWQILTTPSGTDNDPSGDSYGWAYNGVSGNGVVPQWIKERVDLSAFAGQEVQLRFEYITDTAVYTEGFLLDDLRIEAIGYEEGFEQGSGGWIAEGFVRTNNLLPQGYRLAIVERGAGIRVRKLDLGLNNSATVRLDFNSEIEDVILVVTGTSRYSWIPAPYRIEIVE